MEALKKPGGNRASDIKDLHASGTQSTQTRRDKFNTAAAAWGSLGAFIERHSLTDRLGLTPHFAKCGPGGELVIGSINEVSSLPVSLRWFDQHHNESVHYPFQLGQYTPCNWHVDATAVVVAESYLSGLVLAAMCGATDGPITYVVAAHSADNIGYVLSGILKAWPHLDFAVAPDDPNAEVMRGIPVLRPEPPKSVSSWVDLRKWSQQCAA